MDVNDDLTQSVQSVDSLDNTDQPTEKLTTDDSGTSREGSLDPDFRDGPPQRGRESSVDSVSGFSPKSETALFNAINNLDLKAVETLIRQGTDLTFRAPVYKGRTALHELVLTQMSMTPLEWTSDLHLTFIDILTLLMDNGVDINAVDDLRKTGLHYASTSSGRSGIMKVLMTSGVDPNIKDNTQQTALHKAVLKGGVVEVETLLEGGSDPNLLDVTGCSPLHLASKRKHNIEITEALLKAGARVNECTLDEKSTGCSPLHLAVKFGSLDNARMLLDNGADLRVRDIAGQTPIIVAARHDLTGKMLTLLIEYGANVNDQDTVYGETLLHKAVRHDMMENMAVLAKYKADPNRGDLSGDTPLHAAATFCYKTPVWVRLITMGGYVNLRNNAGLTPLDKALKAKNPVGIALMRDCGFTHLS